MIIEVSRLHDGNNWLFVLFFQTKDDDDDWGEDFSEDAVKQRMEELSDAAKGLAMTDDLEKSPQERLDMFFQFVKVCIYMQHSISMSRPTVRYKRSWFVPHCISSTFIGKIIDVIVQKWWDNVGFPYMTWMTDFNTLIWARRPTAYNICDDITL